MSDEKINDKEFQESPKSKKEPKTKRSFGTKFTNQVEGFSNGGLPLLVTVITTFVVMILVCLAVFFASVQGEEKVLVPNVVGKGYIQAAMEMQEKELYPRIELRYSDVPGEEGKVLEQSPAAGSIVKAYRQINLIISRGVAIDRMENYVGKNIDEIQPRIQTLFSGKDSFISVSDPIYQKSNKAAGVIIAQYPEEDSVIGASDKLILIVSSGSNTPTANVPDLKGLEIAKVYKAMESSNIVFNFTSHNASAAETAGTVSSQEKAGQTVEAFSRVNAEFAFPVAADDGEAANETVYGIFTYKAAKQPFPVPVTLELNDVDGNVSDLVHFSHPGEEITIPYAVKKGSVLSLYVMDSLVTQQVVQ